MKLLPLLSLLLLLTGAFSHADDLAPVTVSAPNLFQYTAPAGWKIQTLPNDQFPAALEIKDQDVAGLITVNMDNSPTPLEDWCTNSIEKNTTVFAQYSPTFGRLTSFHTTAGVMGFTCFVDLTAHGKKLHSLYYFFAGSNDTRFAVTCTCALTDAAHYDPLFQAAAKTFAPN